jgi:filamentous hemagglutinin
VAAALVLLAPWLAATVVLAGATSAAAVPAAATTCTDNWVGPASGTSNWATAADWSAGVPKASSVACIKKAGTYTVQASTPGEAAAAVMVGGAASGTQTLKIDGVNFPITQSSSVLKGGVLSLAPTSSASAAISATGTTVSLTIAAGGTLSSAGAANAALIGTPVLVNKGAVTLAAASTNDDAATTDKGSFTVAAGAVFTSSGTGFTHAAGKLTVHGTFNSENTFTQSGGTETGHAVAQHAGTFIDSAGTGSFTAYQATIEGTIPAGQKVTNLASPGNSNDTIGSAATGVTVDGTLTCQTISSTICSFSTNGNWPGITVASGGTLSATGPGSASKDVLVNLNANMDIKAGGTLTIANPATMVNAFTLTNSGTWQVTATGNITIGGNCAITSTGTIGVTVGSNVTHPDGTIDTTNISNFTATGTLAVHTDGNQAGAAVITTRGGLSADFSKLSFTPPTDTYTVSYPSNEVEVTPTTG